MKITGGCYCGAVRYAINGDFEAAFQCHCRECQYITGGNANIVMVFSKDHFQYTKGTPATFARSDLDNPVSRHFCATCGTAIGTRSPSRPDSMIVKVGTMDDPSAYESKAAIFTCDMQPYHHIPDDVPRFDKRPPKKD